MKKIESQKPYVYQEFPKWKYHKSEGSRLIHTKEQDISLGDAWADAPFSGGDDAIEAEDLPQEQSPKRRGRPAKAKL